MQKEDVSAHIWTPNEWCVYSSLNVLEKNNDKKLKKKKSTSWINNINIEKTIMQMCTNVDILILSQI